MNTDHISGEYVRSILNHGIINVDIIDLCSDYHVEGDDIQLSPVPPAGDASSPQPLAYASPTNKPLTMKKRKRVTDGEDVGLTKPVISSEISTSKYSSLTQEELPETTDPDTTLTKRKKIGVQATSAVLDPGGEHFDTNRGCALQVAPKQISKV